MSRLTDLSTACAQANNSLWSYGERCSDFAAGLRTTFAAELRALHEHDIADLLGHNLQAVTGTYSTPEALEEAANKLEPSQPKNARWAKMATLLTRLSFELDRGSRGSAQG